MFKELLPLLEKANVKLEIKAAKDGLIFVAVEIEPTEKNNDPNVIAQRFGGTHSAETFDNDLGATIVNYRSKVMTLQETVDAAIQEAKEESDRIRAELKNKNKAAGSAGAKPAAAKPEPAKETKKVAEAPNLFEMLAAQAPEAAPAPAVIANDDLDNDDDPNGSDDNPDGNADTDDDSAEKSDDVQHEPVSPAVIEQQQQPAAVPATASMFDRLDEEEELLREMNKAA